jgi:DNA repair exonuclease SbcCD ATPase subunit
MNTGVIPLSGQGRVLIKGPEGAGKSTLCEVLTLVLHGKGSPRIRTNTLGESTILSSETGYKAELAFESGFGAAARSVEIVQAFKHKQLKSRYIISVDGKREEPSTKPEQKKLVKRLVPLSYNEWLGVVYLHQGGIHDLLAGTPAEKREYLTSVFGLDFYDDLITETKEEIKRIEQQVKGSVGIQQQVQDNEEALRTAKAFVAGYDLPSLKTELAGVNSGLQNQAKVLGELEASKNALASCVSAQQAYTNVVETAGKEDFDLSSLQEKLQSLIEIKAGLQQQVRSAVQQQQVYDRVVAQVAATTGKLEGKRSKLATLKPVFSVELIEDVLGALGRARSVELVSFSALVPEKDNGGWREPAMRAMAVAQTLRQLQSMTKLGACCPTCNQALPDLSSSIQTQEALLKEARETARNNFTQRIAAKLGVTKLPALDVLSQDLNNQLQAHQLITTLKNEISTLETELAGITTPDPPQDTTDLNKKLQTVQNKIQQQEAEIKTAQMVFNAKARYDAAMAALPDNIDADLIENQIHETNAQIALYRKKQMELTRQIGEAEGHNATYKTLLKQRESLDAKVEQYAELAGKHKEYVDVLLPYFEAVRASKVRGCVSVLEGILPVYVSSMVSGSQEYAGAEIRLKVSDDLTSVDMELRSRATSPWLSAIQASGGQRRRFTLATIAALREISPRKANIMFFDEPFADLESEGKLLFVNRLLPTLMDRCPDLESVFTVAHDYEVLQSAKDAFDHVWTAQRSNTGSKLKLE